MKENLDFVFDNELSSDFGIINVNIEGYLYSERLLGNRQLKETAIAGRTEPYFMGVEQTPMDFSLAFAFLNGFDDDLIRRVNRWLNVDYYKEFYFVENPKYRYFVMPINEGLLYHNGIQDGYVQLTMRSRDIYAYSQEILTDVFDFSENTSEGMSLEIFNDGDVPLSPEMWINKVGDGEIVIINKDDGGNEFRLENIKDGESLYVNNEFEDIQTNIPNLYHYDDLKTNFLSLPSGTNNLIIHGNFTLQMRYRAKYMIGI